MDVSKTRASFYRRLYVAWLIDSGAATSVPALAELDIDCAFEQEDGERHNAGRYAIRDWGPIDRRWVAAQLPRLKSVLGYP